MLIWIGSPPGHRNLNPKPLDSPTHYMRLGKQLLSVNVVAVSVFGVNYVNYVL